VAVGLEFTDDVEAAGARHAAGYALTIGAMGGSASPAPISTIGWISWPTSSTSSPP
jgi:hypothetical protein